MIQITLDEKKDGAANSDPLKRSQIGWSDGLYDRQLHDIARGVWAMPGSRIGRKRFAVVNGGGTIRHAMEIDRVVDVAAGRRARLAVSPGSGGADGRRAPFLGKGLLWRKQPSSLLSAAARSASARTYARRPAQAMSGHLEGAAPGLAGTGMGGGWGKSGRRPGPACSS